MASSVPIVRQIAWVSLIPQLAVMAILIWLAWMLGLPEPVLMGAAAYLVLSVALRTAIARDHRKGMALVKRARFAEAIPYFEAAYRRFVRRPWLDRHRFILLLSSSRMSYKEIALCNIAFCHGQLGDGAKAREYYERALQESPGSAIATTALRFLDAGKNVG